MKEFVRFLVTILVLGLVAGTIYYAAKTEENRQVNFENNQVEEDLENNPDIPNEEVKVENNVGVIEDAQSSTDNATEQLVYDTNNFVLKFTDAQYTEIYDTAMGSDFLGSKVDEYMNAFAISEVPVTVHKVAIVDGVKLIVIPMPDVLDNQVFFYDQNGKLVLYNSESNGVGGAIHYYFSDDILVQTLNHLEDTLELNFEQQDEILMRANKLYNLYNKN